MVDRDLRQRIVQADITAAAVRHSHTQVANSLASLCIPQAPQWHRVSQGYGTGCRTGSCAWATVTLAGTVGVLVRVWFVFRTHVSRSLFSRRWVLTGTPHRTAADPHRWPPLCGCPTRSCTQGCSGASASCWRRLRTCGACHTLDPCLESTAFSWLTCAVHLLGQKLWSACRC
jgi:hypothetical protein